MRKWMIGCMVLSCAVLVLCMGCGTKASEDKPLEEVKAEAAKMGAESLQGMIDAYKKEIGKRKAELKSVQDELGKVKPLDLLKEEGKKLTAKASNIGQAVKNLTERMTVYVQELAKKKAE